MKLHADLLKAALDQTDGVAQEELQMFNRAYSEFIHKKYQGVMTISFENNDLSPLANNIKTERDKQTRVRAKNMGTLYLWLTVSPDEKKYL